MAFRARRPDSAVSRIDKADFPVPFELPFDPDGEARVVVRRAGCDANSRWDKARARLVPRPMARIVDAQSAEARRLMSHKMSEAQRQRRQLRHTDLERLSEEAQRDADEKVMGMSLDQYAAVDAKVRKSSGAADGVEEPTFDFDEYRLRVADALVDSFQNFNGADLTALDDKLMVVGFSGSKLVWQRDGRVEYLTRLQMENMPEEIARGVKSGSIKVDDSVTFDGEWTGEDGTAWFWPDGQFRDKGPGEVIVYYVQDCADDLEKGRGPALAAARLDSRGSDAGTAATSGG